MNSYLKMLAGTALAVLAAPALAALNVFATMPEWGALAEELGGDKVKVYTATNALQDAASCRGEAEPDRARAQRGSRRRHRAPSSKSAGCRSSRSRPGIRRSSPASPAISKRRRT